MGSRENARRAAGAAGQASARSAALEQLKRLREGGGRRVDTFELKVEEQIFDRLDEKDYALLVAKRRLESQDFVVDDDGLGYADIGEEENWDVGAMPESSDEEDGAAKKKKIADPKKKRDVPSRKERELMAAASLMGKQSVSSMFAAAGSGMSVKSSKARDFDGADQVLDDVLAAVGADSVHRERKKKHRQTSEAKEDSHFSREMPSLMADMEIAAKVEEDSLPPPPSTSEKQAEDSAVSTSLVADAEVKIKVEEPSRELPPLPFNADHSTSENERIKAAEDSFGLGEMSALPADEMGNLSFFFLDAYEEAFGANSGTVFLFGKVQRGGKYVSCCVAVRNIQRCVFAVPGPSVFPDGLVNTLEQEATSSELKLKLQEMAREMKMELSEKLMELNVSKFSMIPVKRSYAFDRMDVRSGAHYYLKLSYPFKDPTLPGDLRGAHFTSLFGTRTSALETFLIKRRIKGPCWLSISNPHQIPCSSQISWCKVEVSVDSPKDVANISTLKPAFEIPRLIVASISLKTVVNQKQNLNEIVSASVVFCERVKVDAPMPQSEWNKQEMLEHFSIVRKLDGGVYPMGFSSEVSLINNKSGCSVLSCEGSERALLNCLMIKLHQLDPDVLVGHNISGFDLDVLLHRLQACKVPSNVWSRVGRLKRSQMPRLVGGGNNFGGGAGPGVMSCVAGRLLCDTYLSSRELVKEVSYTLTQLSKSQLGKERKEISPSEIPNMFQTSSTLFELIQSGETDAWLSLSLMFHLSVLPLTRQLTNISGNLWSKTLQGARAQRVEYLLLHEFYGRKYIVPDKVSASEKEKDNEKKRKKAQQDEDFEPDSAVEAKNKKAPAYTGGLVLEPKKGLYDKYILLLDFNSLYPSIIQEYNICFTTVERSSDGSISSLPNADAPGVLPQVLKALVDRRKQVKQWLKKTTDVLKYQQMDIQQQALKLTANSMYGCLGFPNSRFYAKFIAELITSQGREILQSTVDLVQNVLNLEVIYGDTDSIMINTGLDDLLKAKSIAAQVIKEVNKKYKLLEIDLDGVFKRMLLLKKKKYACVKVETSADGKLREVIEQRGLDIVRRDWSLLSKDVGNFILEQILSEGSREDVVDAIHDKLRKLQDDMRNGRIELEKYVITKSLSKRPEDYPDSKNQPHVQVALRRKQEGHKCFPGDTIPYVICCQEGVLGVPLAERARHPDELKAGGGGCIIDVDYYLSQQIHPVVSRLCTPIEGTDPSHIADCLGLDPSKFQQRSVSTTLDKEDALVATSVLDDEDRYNRCEALELLCSSCAARYPFPGVSHVLTLVGEDQSEDENAGTQSLLSKLLVCPHCSVGQSQNVTAPKLTNLVLDRAAEFIQRYYDCWMVCDDEMCNHTSRDTILRIVGDAERGAVCPNFPRCNGRLVRQYSQVDLYNQLTHFFRLLDVNRVLQKIPERNLKAAVAVNNLRPLVDLPAQEIKNIRDRCAYRWVQMSSLCVSV
ncbi:DNA polymerase alpha catalytic subunit [Selaginella moellendorffii]|uniref:DNA polymerase alpha catalytic subunit n=1 Tax=Selaginella moellendorffii TaxID=88036 RepID=UPI000D1CB682|nr:DNA polymerase alpha catalytic subunit [Selaginella moellendorffii]|eukprot:XP_024534663.1 DNA polymerase alpha catalytic subunit [Selaginella moellendorffii]